MEVFETEKHYIFVKNGKSLWWNRTTSEVQVKCAFDFAEVFDIECIGITYGIIGEIKFPGVYDPHLLIIKEAIPIGAVNSKNLVYKIKSVCILSQDEPDCQLFPCSKHSTTMSSGRPNSNSSTSSPQSKAKIFDASSNLFNKTLGAMKSAGSSIKNTTQQAASIATTQVKSKVGIKEPYKKLEKRISEEIHKIFDETDSFYYSPDSDITNNLQRKESVTRDDRFFWNKHMLSEILKLDDQLWTLPIIQGFVQVEQCVIENECFTLALVSRRSRFRAGTRYKRRGIDEDGNVANYVETEQILSLRQHQISFTQIRGSVPLYWNQPGFKYRPPPQINKDDEETQRAFKKHFDNELAIYDNICIVSLVEQSGKEKIIGDKYAEHIIQYNNEKLMYVTFDFHEYCRGMRFENVSALIEALATELHDYGFHWRDNNGPIKNQAGIFRVNCMDCLDRTNVVQTALAKAILESQLVKLGLAPPYSQLPAELKTIFMTVWANNGDIISRQYAGTNALKGDYTRTGERKISGMVKDGMNSANRYYLQHFVDTFRQGVIDLLHGKLDDISEITVDDPFEQITNIAQCALIPESRAPQYFYYGVLGNDLKFLEDSIVFASYYLARFKDSYRQATIDLMLGNNVSAESLTALGGQQMNDETDAIENAEHARLLVEDCKRMLLGTSLVIGSWGLIDADPNSGDASETEVDTILLLTNSEFYVADYDSQLDKIVKFENVSLHNITLVEFGLFQQQQIFKSPATAHLCIRINYMIDNVDGYFHMFRSPNIRFFNNTAVVIKKNEELVESMSAIVEFFRITLESIGRQEIPILSVGTLQRRKSRSLLQPPGIPRNLSESQLVQIGSKALSNVAGQFSKLGQSFNPSKGKNNKQNANPPIVYNATNTESKASTFYVGREAKEEDDSDDDNDCSIYEPDLIETEQNPIFNENAFLPSVGIVMSNPPNDDESSPEMLASVPSKDTARNLSDFATMSVTDNIHIPSSMQPLSPMLSPMKTLAPQIKIDGSSMSHTNTPKNELNLNLSGSQSENAIKQLKSLTSPLSMFAKGVQSLGLASKSQSQLSELIASDANSKRLEEKFAESKCKSKLIAL